MRTIPRGTSVDALLALLAGAGRSCGECQACCVALAVPAMRKRAGHRCSAQAVGGCKIYDVRPAECWSFKCMWLEGITPVADRPDAVGYVLSAHRTRMGAVPVVVMLNGEDSPPVEFPVPLKPGTPWAVCVPHPEDNTQMMYLHLPGEMSDQEAEAWRAAVAELDQDV